MQREEGSAGSGSPSAPTGSAVEDSGRKRSWGAWVAALGVLLATKLKALVPLALGAAKLLKLAQFGPTLLTMGLTALLYAQRYGAAFGVGLVFLIFVHEMGHGVMARRLGLAVGAPIFIPFVGAFIALRDQPKSRWDNALIGAGGPLFGLGGAAAALLLGRILPGQSALLSGLAYFTAQMNLFNLLPIFGLDGDRVSDPLAHGQLLGAAAFAVAVAVALGGVGVHAGPLLCIVAVLLAVKAFVRWRARTAPDAPVSEAPEAWRAMALYLGLAFALALLCRHASGSLLTRGA